VEVDVWSPLAELTPTANFGLHIRLFRVSSFEWMPCIAVYQFTGREIILSIHCRVTSCVGQGRILESETYMVFSQQATLNSTIKRHKHILRTKLQHRTIPASNKKKVRAFDSRLDTKHSYLCLYHPSRISSPSDTSRKALSPRHSRCKP
jgi:hypothetical protein